MQKFSYLAFLSLFIITACNLVEINPDGKKKTSNEMTYNYACLDSAVGGSSTAKAIGRTTDVIRRLAIKDKDITDKVQNEYGDAFHQDAIESKTFVLANDAKANANLQAVMKDLLKARENPSTINYSIYLIEDSAINAFTFGGHIYLTRAMYAKCSNNQDLLYSIIGHEIGHSEKGHIRKTIQEMKIAENIFGDENGVQAFQVLKILTGSFNQKNELEADYYGTDLSYRLDHNVCAAVKFWDEMSGQENDYNKLEDFFRTHPFSALRAKCLRQHIQENFGKTCD